MSAAAGTALFTPEQVTEDGRNRVARTTAQVGVPAASITIGEWVAHLVGWRGSIPGTVRDAMIVILTACAAAWTNRHRLRGKA